jgi:UDP-N-acetylglucosamine 2-epimerase (non-hydrolysing)
MSSEGAVAHVVGARPNFMKASPVLTALRGHGIRQVVIHTGQHYDPLLSDVFFADLGLPRPDVNLGVGSGTHAEQTAALLVGMERALRDIAPSLTIVYGDVNSTLATALVAAKLGQPLAHVEAGLRSFDDSMPEEINRRVTDLLSELLFVTSPEGVENLVAMGMPADQIHFVGNPMIDTLLASLERLDPAPVLGRLGLSRPYGVATLHRPSNVDDNAQAGRMVAMLRAAASHAPIVLPLHPRGRAALVEAGVGDADGVSIVEPMGYLEFMSLVRASSFVITDSGGIQEETTILGVPCLTVRPNTERPITITHGTNRLIEPGAVGGAVDAILGSAATASRPGQPPLWDGHAGDRIAKVIAGWLAERARPNQPGVGNVAGSRA